MNTQQIHLIATIVENKPGVLYEISNMFRCRGFNIDSISVGQVETSDLARMTITVKGSDSQVEQIVKQLHKIMTVIKVSTLDPENTVVRELALVKVHTVDAKARSEIIQYANIFRAHIVDISHDSLIAEVTGDSEKIDAFIDISRQFGIKEIARTGKTALTRGGKVIKE